MLQWLADLLVSMVEWIPQALWFFFTEFYSYFSEFCFNAIATVLNFAGINFSVPFAVDVYEQINYCFPLNEGFALLTLIMLLWFSIWIIKIVLKAIPTVY